MILLHNITTLFVSVCARTPGHQVQRDHDFPFQILTYLPFMTTFPCHLTVSTVETALFNKLRIYHSCLRHTYKLVFHVGLLHYGAY